MLKVLLLIFHNHIYTKVKLLCPKNLNKPDSKLLPVKENVTLVYVTGRATSDILHRMTIRSPPFY